MRKPIAVQMNRESSWKKEMNIMADYSKNDKSSKEYNKSVSLSQQIRDLHNCAVNRPMILNRIANGTAHDLSAEPYKDGKPVVLVSSGPSLDDHIPFLKQWTGDIICMWQQATTLIFHGITPTFIMVTDVRSTYEGGLAGVDWSKTKTKLVTLPGCWKSIFEMWPNDILLYRIGNGENQGFHKFTQNIIFSHTDDDHVGSLKGNITLHPFIPTEILVYGSGASSVMALASGLHYGKIILCGFDFGGHSGKSRFSKASFADGKWTLEKNEIKNTDEVVDNISTTNTQRYYKRQFLASCRRINKLVYTMDTISNSPFPIVTPEKILKGKWPKYKMTHVASLIDDYLAENGMYPVTTSSGVLYYELDSYEKLIQAMTLQNRVYKCTNCQSTFQFKEDGDYTGFYCDNCKTGKLVKNMPVDVEYNAKRLKKYF